MKHFKLNRLLMLLVAFLTMSINQVWGAENDTHDFTTDLPSSVVLNNKATIKSVSIAQQSYPVKEVIVSYTYNNKKTNAVTISVNVGGDSWGSVSSNSSTSGTTTASPSFKTTPQTAVKGAITVSFTNNTTATSGCGTFSVTKIQLVEGGSAPAAPINVVLSRNGATTNFNGQTAPFDLPDASAESPACDGWVFKGWTKTNSVNSTTAPEFITSVSESCTVYAVYGKTEGGGSTTTTYTLSGNWTTDNGNWTKVSTTTDLSSNLATGKYGLNTNTSSSATSPMLYTGISSVKITGSKSSSGSGTWSIQYGSGNTWTDLLSSENDKAVGSTATWTPTTPVNGYLKVTMKRTAGNVYLASIAVTYTTATTTYKTAPECGPSTYTASIADGLINGSINLGTSANTLETLEGSETITIDLTPADGYEVGTVTVTKAGGGTVETSGTGNTRTFTMPTDNVTVSATFSRIKIAPTITPTNKTCYVGQDFDVTSMFSSNSTGAITYSVTGTPVGAVYDEDYIFSENKLYSQIAGVYTITASQEAAGDYMEGSQTATITVEALPVEKVDPTIVGTDKECLIDAIFDVASMFESNSDGAITYSVLSAPTEAQYDLEGSDFLATTAGDYTIQASQAADGAYNAGSQTAKLTVKEPATATLTLSELGETHTLAGSHLVGDVVNLPTTVSVDCQGKQFVGWSSTEVSETDAKPSFYEPGAEYTLSAETQTLLAVYAKVTSTSDTWTKTNLSSLTSSDVFVLVGTNGNSYAISNTATTSSPVAIQVSVSGNDLSSETEVTDVMKWKVSGDATNGYSFYSNADNSNYLYSNTTQNSGSNTNIRVGNGQGITNYRKVWELNNNYIKTKDSYTARFLSVYTTEPDWRGYTSGSTTIAFYKLIAGEASTTKYATSGTKLVPLASIQAIQEAATAEAQTVKIAFDDWVVTGVASYDGQEIAYVSDGSEYGLEIDFDAASGYAVGDKLNGTISAAVKKTADVMSIYDLSTTLAITKGGSVEAIEKTLPEISKANNGIVVSLNSLTFVDGGQDYYSYFKDASNNKIYFDNDFATDGIWAKLIDNALYNITGVIFFDEDGDKFIACRTSDEFIKVLPAPTNLVVSNVAANSMSVSWTAVDGATSYDVIVDDGEPVSVTTNSKALTGLSSCTQYTIKVIAKGNNVANSATAEVSESTLNDKTITISLTNTIENGDNKYKAGDAIVLPCEAEEIVLNYSVTEDYDLPEAITVTIGGAEAAAGVDYTWNAVSGVLTIPAAKQTGSIVVTISSPTTTKVYYRLNFDRNGGTGDAMSEVKIVATASEADRTIALPTCTYIPPVGKEFDCWSLSTTEVSPITELLLNQETNVVYAIWKDITYTLESISINTEPKTAYEEGETLDLTGLKINAIYSASYGEGKTDVISTGFTTSPEAGTVLNASQDITVSFGGKTCTYAVTVSQVFDIEYHVAVGAVADGAETKVAEGGTFTYPEVTGVTCLAGYEFAGWTTDGEFADGATAPTGMKAAGATSAAVSAKVELYAVYKQTKTTTTDFATFAADGNIASAPFVIASKVGTDYKALPVSGYPTTSSGGSTIAAVESFDIAKASDLEANKMIFIKNGANYNIKYNDTYYLSRKGSGDTGLKGVTTAANWTVSDGLNGSYRLLIGNDGRCVAYRTGTINKFGYYGTGNVTSSSTEYYDVELIPVPQSVSMYSIDPDCKEERKLTLQSSEGTTIRLVEGETEDAKTTTITAVEGTGSAGDITLNCSDEVNVSIDGANVTFKKDGTYVINASQAAGAMYSATTAMISIIVQKAFVTLTYDGNGATDGVPAVVTEIEKGAPVTLAAGNTMTYTGKAFTKWGSDEAGTTKYAAGANYTVSKSTTLYALWQDAPQIHLATVAHGLIESNYEYALENTEVTLTTTADAGYTLKPGSLKVTKSDGTTVYCSAAGKFTMPNEDVYVTAEFVVGALYKQRRQNPNMYCDQTGAYPDDASAEFVSTYATGTNNQSVSQLTGGNNMTYTISGYEGAIIKSITLSMRSNSSSGTGTMYVKVGDKTVAQIVENTAFTGWFDNTAWSTSFVNVHVDMPKTYVDANENIVINIAASDNSLYCESVFIEWAEATYTRDITGTYGTICLPKAVEAGDFAGASFFEGDYLLMSGSTPYKYYLSEVDHLEAGYPYVFVANDGASKIALAESGDADFAHNRKGLVGTLDIILDWAAGDSRNTLEGNYFIYDNEFRLCGAWCGLNANRAYLNINNSDVERKYQEEPAQVGGRKRIALTNNAAQTTTGFDGMMEEEINSSDVRKMLINNVIYIVRGGMMFDLNGRLVK